MNTKTISIAQAATQSKNYPETIRRWVKRHPGLGFRFGPRNYRIRQEAWDKLCAGIHPADLEYVAEEGTAE
jgi:hypothetical protein